MDPNTIITFQGTISQDMIPIMMMYIHIFHPISNQDLVPTTFPGLLFIDHLPSLPKEVDNLRKFKDHKYLKVIMTYNNGLTQWLFRQHHPANDMKALKDPTTFHLVLLFVSF